MEKMDKLKSVWKVKTRASMALRMFVENALQRQNLWYDTNMLVVREGGRTQGIMNICAQSLRWIYDVTSTML